MAEKNLKMVGKVIEAHSLKGEVYVFIFSGDVSWVPKLEQFELRQTENSPTGIHFTVERFRKHKKGIILKTKELADRTAAEKYEKWFFFVDDGMFDSDDDEDGILYLSEIQGFTVRTQNEDLGVITGFYSNVAQDILLVEKNDKKFEIPFVQDFIVEINFDEKFIMMDLPPGLLEINA